jgi:cytochrome c553
MRATALILSCVLTNALAVAADDPVDFNRDVRPILSDRCYGCHGPDADKGRKAGLRLDEFAGAIKELKSGERAIVPGDIEKSAMVHRMRTEDPEEIMPPPELHRPLTPAEKDILTRWIKQGAKYDPHWAFVSPRAQPTPKVADAAWVRDPLDAFIAAQAVKAGLKTSLAADRTTLLRRASFALTGLPPTADEVAAFLADTSADAYEKRVDAMLASPRFGEHLAVGWLDLSRYADTWGYTGDKAMFAWPWRDWVLKAFNENKPYDQFLTEQLAGDLLPSPTQDQRVATAYNRLHRMTFEGGSIAEEFRQDGINDRVMTAGYGFMGLTMECSRCHDHKYDPISQRDYFSMAAMFGDQNENGLLSYHGEVPPPFVRLYKDDAERKKEAELRAAVTAAEMGLSAVRSEYLGKPEVKVPSLVAHFPLDSFAKSGVDDVVAGGKPAVFERRGSPEDLQLTPGVKGQAVKFDGDAGFKLADFKQLGRFDPFTFSAHLRLGEKNARATVLHATGFYTGDGDATGVELLVVQGRLRWSMIHLWPNSAASIETTAELPVGSWQRVTVTYDGSSKAAGLRIYLDGREAKTTVVRDTLHAKPRDNALEIGSRSRDAGFRNGSLDEIQLWRQALTAAEVAILHGLDVQNLPPPVLAEHAKLRVDPAYAAAWKKFQEAQRAHAAHQESAPAFFAMEHSPLAPKAYVLTRGEYDKPDLAKPCEPGVPTRVFPWDESLPKNRLGLARWLTDPRHPLTSRVVINRLWAQVFGSGLVATSENLGLQGDLPTHPELLDTLAVDFVRSGWNTKAMLRRFVLSSTFRQSSTPTAEAREKDPANKYLARGPVLRLTAEMVRDQALLASGKLVEKIGGESVQESANRRSLYTYRKRTAPPDNMLIFDAGSREVCQPKRLNTNTPLQALVLLNNPGFVEAAKSLATKASQASNDPSAQIVAAFRAVCTRDPRPTELAALKELYATQKANPPQFTPAPSPEPKPMAAAKPDAKSKKKAAPAPMPAPTLPKIPADPALAALTLVCSTILASDAAVTSR